MGLRDEKDMTMRGIEAAKNADVVYAELYTGVWDGLDALENSIGKKIIRLQRESLEQKSDEIVDESVSKNVVILIPGDPLVATTHISLMDDAMANGVKTKVIHNSSIFSAVCETGLHVYKFGATATVPFSDRTGGKLPISTYETLARNRKAGLHTLLLLDLTPEKQMTPNEAIRTMLDVEDELKESMFTKDTRIVVFARAGSDDSEITFGKVGELEMRAFGPSPMVIIVPGVMHFSESDYLSHFDIGRIREQWT
jgi:diphthine synthase